MSQNNPTAPSVAVKALQPFATDADIYDGQNIDDGEKSFNDNITVGDLRRARTAYSALSAQVQDVADLDTRMKSAGMYTIAEMMGVTPLTKWKSNPAINTIEAFSEWLDRKVSEYLSMKAGYDLGDKSEDDDLFEWVLAHAGVFSTIRDQFQVVTAAPAAKLEEKP